MLYFLLQLLNIHRKILYRITHEIIKDTGIYFDGSSAAISISNKEYDAIRIKFIEDYESIAQLQSLYAGYGVVFAISRKVRGVEVILIKKIFKISPLTDEIYKDEEDDIYYLKIEKFLNWDHFRKITTQVRNNMSLAAFDAAPAVFYRSEVVDVIRIYSKTISLEELKELQNKYREVIQKSF